jgi:hypothetical protein
MLPCLCSKSLKNAGAFVGQVEASQMHYFGAGAIRLMHHCGIVHHISVHRYGLYPRA